MKISIIEPNHNGHTFTYVRHVAAAAEAVGADYTIHCTETGCQSPEFLHHLGHIPIDRVDASLEPIGQGRFHIYGTVNRILKHVNATSKPDIVVYPTADFAAVAAGLGRLTGRNPLTAKHSYCLMTKLGFAYPGTERKLVDWVEQCGLRQSAWDEIGMIDLVAYLRLLKRKHPVSNRLRLFPDPISVFPGVGDQTQCRMELGWDPSTHIFLCSGIIRAGKGVNKLLTGFLRLPQSVDATLIFAGSIRNDVKPAFENPEVQAGIKRKRILIQDGCLSEKQWGQAFCAADVNCCIYPRQNHPSSIAITSVAYQRPVIYADSLWLGEMGARFELGFPCHAFDPQSVADAMKASIEDQGRWRPSSQAKKLIQFQSASNFVATWEDTFRRIDNPNHVNRAMDWDEFEL